MPVAKIHVLEGQYNEARLGKVSSAVQNGLISALGIPPEDFFQIVHVLPRGRFLHTPSFLGLNYSDDLIILEHVRSRLWHFLYDILRNWVELNVFRYNIADRFWS